MPTSVEIVHAQIRRALENRPGLAPVLRGNYGSGKVQYAQTWLESRCLKDVRVHLAVFTLEDFRGYPVQRGAGRVTFDGPRPELHVGPESGAVVDLDHRADDRVVEACADWARGVLASGRTVLLCLRGDVPDAFSRLASEVVDIDSPSLQRLRLEEWHASVRTRSSRPPTY